MSCRVPGLSAGIVEHGELREADSPSKRAMSGSTRVLRANSRGFSIRATMPYAGDHQPTVHDMEDARRVKRALDLLHIPLVDYVIAGELVTSLLQKGVI